MKLSTGNIFIRFVQKSPKFCRIFVVTIFLEELRHFLNMTVNTKKKNRKNSDFQLVFSFFIRNPLMDRPVI